MQDKWIIVITKGEKLDTLLGYYTGLRLLVFFMDFSTGFIIFTFIFSLFLTLFSLWNLEVPGLQGKPKQRWSFVLRMIVLLLASMNILPFSLSPSHSSRISSVSFSSISLPTHIGSRLSIRPAVLGFEITIFFLSYLTVLSNC